MLVWAAAACRALAANPSQSIPSDGTIAGMQEYLCRQGALKQT
eukprot:CAMPEP_0197936608 /NCGR_PEP_ID=MMETSP1439-20131203/115214_1 /TAXON_ID=66791 /ORGANISM="Gonyaulax spinifera, Strain CCMP409" /LENGTH=42 /DNA_ID= /DNA_START= /DNA_END= /DNA_ORIENTATION=